MKKIDNNNMKQYYLKMYDSRHNLLDNSINNICDLKYQTVLNGQGYCEFSIPRDEPKCSNKLMFPTNHIEVYNMNHELLWYGVISRRVFSGSMLQISCVGYEWLLGSRIFRNDITFYDKHYGRLIELMVGTVQGYDIKLPLPITMGKVIENDLITTREIKSGDVLKDKIDEYIEDSNYYYNVDDQLRLNVSYSVGEKKDYLKLIYDQEGYSNIIDLPEIEENLDDIYNNVYAHSEFDQDTGEGNNKVKVVLDYDEHDMYSITLYGLREKKLSVNDIHLMETLKSKVGQELDICKFPNISLTLKCVDSALCPMNQVKVGDYITVEIPYYFGFKNIIRVLEIERDCKTDEYTLTMGSLVYRPQKPQIKKYKN